MQLVQTVAPTQEPLTLSEVKEFVRVLDDDSDTILTSLIVSVREHVENVTNRQLCVATYELFSNRFISRLQKNPIKSIDKIEYMDESGDYQTLSASSYYLYEENGVGYIEYDSDFIPFLVEHKKAVKITFTSGYDTIPESIKQYMKVKISTLFENREQYVVGVSISDFGGNFIENIIGQYKVRAV